MDFNHSEEQQAISKVARQILEERSAPEHLSELEAGETRYDASLWKELAGADLLGIALPEAVGGSGHTFLELGVLLEEVGWSVAPVPVYPTLVLGADPIARFGSAEQRQRYLPGVVAGTVLLSGALMEPGRSDPTRPATTATPDGSGWRVDGTKELVPAAQLAEALVVPAATSDGDGIGLFIIGAAEAGVGIRPVDTTNGEPHADLVLDGVHVAAGERIGDPRHGVEMVRSLFDHALVGLCAVQLGVAERAIRIAAAYTSEREQFGRLIGSFQAVQQRMADAFIDVEAMRWTAWHAAWLLATGRRATREARIAKFWAAEAGARVAATAQQVHGGIGIDTSYPLYRYFLWAKHNELALGSASQQLAQLGDAYVEDYR
jgi:hypothetical protein